MSKDVGSCFKFDYSCRINGRSKSVRRFYFSGYVNRNVELHKNAQCNCTIAINFVVIIECILSFSFVRIRRLIRMVFCYTMQLSLQELLHTVNSFGETYYTAATNMIIDSNRF